MFEWFEHENEDSNPSSWRLFSMENQQVTFTLLEINIAPEKWWLEDHFYLGMGELLLLGRVNRLNSCIETRRKKRIEGEASGSDSDFAVQKNSRDWRERMAENCHRKIVAKQLRRYGSRVATQVFLLLRFLGGGLRYFSDFFFFTFIWGRFLFWLICFRWVETTNQILFSQITGGWGLERSCG